MAKTSPENKHVAVFAFPYGSHAAPLLNLVIKLALASPHVTFSFFSIQQSIQSLFSNPKIPQNVKPYSVSDGIPEGHVLGNNPVEKVNLFLQAGTENLKNGLDLAVAETKQSVTCIISDIFVTSSLLVAEELQVPWIAFWVSYSIVLSAHIHTELIRQHFSAKNSENGEDKSLAFIPGLSKMKIEDLPEDLLIIGDGEEESVFSRMLASIGRLLPQAKAVVINFFQELEPPLLVQDLRSKTQSLIYAGFLTLSLPPPSLPPSDTDATGCLSWLDGHITNSVAYISFGSVVTLPPHEIIAVAEALEEAAASGVSFLWVLKDNLKPLLPDGFVERTRTKGKIVPWAPQTHVLAHDSVGVFVTQGGCNSVSESVSYLVPMICRPYFGDQMMAARMIQDIWEIGLKIEGGVFTKNALLKSLNRILVQEEGKMMREKAETLRKMVLEAAGPNGSTTREFRTLVEIIYSS